MSARPHEQPPADGGDDATERDPDGADEADRARPVGRTTNDTEQQYGDDESPA